MAVLSNPMMLCSVMIVLLSLTVEAKTRHYNFTIRLKNYTRLCHTKPIVTVNGKYPGPTIYAREGDTVLVNVTNHVKYNVTIHWHGIRQLRTGWSDGPAYITQCPIQTRQSFVYNFTITGQRGEWWNADTEAVVNQAMKSGGAPNVSNAHTINGKPGPLFNCSTKDTYALAVEPDKTYLLRIINAALNDQVFFSIGNHPLKVVEVDAVYTKPFETKAIAISPGQTTNALLDTSKKTGRYFMTVRAFMDAPITVDNLTSAGIIQYIETPNTSNIVMPVIPKINDTAFYTNFSSLIKSLNSPEYPANVPQTVDRNLFFTVGLALDTCSTCVNGSRAAASINNVSFVMPTIALLQAHVNNISGVFTKDFPDNPPTPFNYTGTPPKNVFTSKGTRATSLTYNSTVQLILQDTSFLTVDNHPVHLHGFNFFIVGTGFGNYNPKTDPASFNLVDPPERNTVGVPTGGWTAIRFRADNPGVWFMHCHLEVHTTWGLKMAFVVENGNGPEQSVLPPPPDLPAC